MSSLFATMELDVRLQARNKLYLLGLAVALLLGLGLAAVVPAASRSALLPSFLLLALGSTTYLFVAGLWICEKNSHARPTAPRLGECLLSKVATLSAFAAVECLVWLGVGFGLSEVRMAPLFAGTLLMGALYTLGGLIQVAPCHQVSRFLMPDAVLFGTLASLPVLGELNLLPNPLWYLWPTQPALLLLRGAFHPLAPWQWFYAALYGAFAVAFAGYWAHSALQRHTA